MSTSLKILLITVLAACGVALVAFGFVQHGEDLSNPATLLLFLLVAMVYLLPTWLAIYRDCKAKIWIALVNVFLGWTVFGWFLVIGCAASSKISESAHSIGRSTHPVPGH